MGIRQKLTLATLVLGIGAATAAGAATVSLGTYTFDTNSLASTASSTNVLYDGNAYVNASASPALTDSAGWTFLGAVNGQGSVGVNLGFTNDNIVNGTGADLALFFLFDQSNNSNSVSINGTSHTLLPTDYLDVNSSGGTLQVANGVAWNGGTLDNVKLTVALIDLSNFGVADNALSNSLSVSLDMTDPNPNQISSLSLVGGINTTSVVPVPAAVWLFGSGLIGLAGISARKRA